MSRCKGEFTTINRCPKIISCTECPDWDGPNIQEPKSSPESPNPTKPVDPLERAKELANDHWEYVKGILEGDHASIGKLARTNYHYTTAFIHGYKHALEDIKSKEVIEPEGN